MLPHLLFLFIPRVPGSKIKSNLPGAGWRPVLKLVDPLSFLCAEQRKDANEPRHIVDANSISLAPVQAPGLTHSVASPLPGQTRFAELCPGYILRKFHIIRPGPEGPGLIHSTAPPFQIEPACAGLRFGLMILCRGGS